FFTFLCFFFFFSMLRPPPTSTLFPTRRSSDLWFEAPCMTEKALRTRVFFHEGYLRRFTPGRLQIMKCFRVHRKETAGRAVFRGQDRKSTRLNSSHLVISYAVFCLKKKK